MRAAESAEASEGAGDAFLRARVSRALSLATRWLKDGLEGRDPSARQETGWEGWELRRLNLAQAALGDLPEGPLPWLIEGEEWGAMLWLSALHARARSEGAGSKAQLWLDSLPGYRPGEHHARQPDQTKEAHGYTQMTLLTTLSASWRLAGAYCQEGQELADRCEAIACEGVERPLDGWMDEAVLESVEARLRAEVERDRLERATGAGGKGARAPRV